MKKIVSQVAKSLKRRDKEPSEDLRIKIEVVEEGKKPKWKRWLKIGSISVVLSILIVLITWIFVNPTFDLREAGHIVDENLVMSNQDFPPVKLVYDVNDNGEPQSQYKPSSSYTLYTIRQVEFINPIIWAPRKTYYPTHEGSKLAKVVASPNLNYEEMNDAAVAVWTTMRRSSGETSSIEITWKLPGFGADNIALYSKIYDDNTVRVYISNPNNYHVQYLAMVELPPMKANTVYTTNLEHVLPGYVSTSGSPQISSVPRSLEIRCAGDTEGTFKVELPFVIEMPAHTGEVYDIQIVEQPPAMAFFWQPPGPTAPARPSAIPLWVWLIVVIVAISVIIILPFMLLRRRHR